MMKNRAEWACENGQITEIQLSDGCGGENIPMTVKMGTVEVDLRVIWEMSGQMTVPLIAAPIPDFIGALDTAYSGSLSPMPRGPRAIHAARV